MQSFFLRKQPQLKAASTKPTSDSSQESGPAVPWHTGMSKRQEEKSVQYHQERVERSHKINELYAKQVDVANIARQVGLSRQGVYDYLQMKQPPERTRIHRAGGSQLEPYKDSLIRRWNEGCRSAQQMYREIKAQGYTGSDSAVSRFIAPWRALKGEARSFKSVEPKPETMITPDEGKKKRPPTALQVAHWVTFKEEQRLDWQKEFLSRLCQADQEVQETYELIQLFTTMLRERQGERLDEWLKQVEEQGVAELQSFAQGLQRDYDAVKAGLTLPWSQGPVVGTCPPAQTDQEASLWTGGLPDVTQAGAAVRLAGALKMDTSPIHQKFGRPPIMLVGVGLLLVVNALRSEQVLPSNMSICPHM
jgi:transposase